MGPTGSGKSTTLYTTLELIKSPERKIYTVEDPVERKIDGVVQTEIKPSIGLTFAQVLRALVRADPDMIMVGEIRDLETAKMAADAAITGHLVFSTLHTNDASAAVNRLVEMGVPRYLVAAAWRCFVAQRLVRRLCPHCRKAVTMTAQRWEELGLGTAPRKRMDVYEPVGCSKCFGTGYRGRLGLYEVLDADDDLREIIATGGTVLDIQRHARARGVAQSARRRRRKGARRVDHPPRAASRHRLTRTSRVRREPFPRRLSHMANHVRGRYPTSDDRSGTTTIVVCWGFSGPAVRSGGSHRRSFHDAAATAPSAGRPHGRLSTTRWALPSLRCSLPGSTSLTLGRTSSAERSSSVTRRSNARRSSIQPSNSVFGDLHLHLERVLAVHAVEHDEVERLDALDGQQHLLDGGREDVDAADDEHVVGAAHDLAHARQGAAAGARLVRERAEVARAVAQHRRALARDGGVHELARPLRPPRAGRWPGPGTRR